MKIFEKKLFMLLLSNFIEDTNAMVNMVFSIRIPIATGLITGLIVIPRILMYFGLNWGPLDVITSAWATFLVILIAVGILFWPWIKSRKLCMLVYVVMVLVAFFGTLYFCGMPLPL